MIIKLFALFGVLGLTFAVSTLNLIYGWGLSPQNWWIIVGSWIASIILVIITQAISAKG